MWVSGTGTIPNRNDLTPEFTLSKACHPHAVKELEHTTIPLYFSLYKGLKLYWNSKSKRTPLTFLATKL